MFVKREAYNRLIQLSNSFKAVSITGPRQSGKTTLAKKSFPDKKYVSLENIDHRNFAIEDPRGFLETYSDGAILDEIQNVPVLFSYLQEILDNTTQKALFILTGSNNFLLQQSISQSLAGRIGALELLPFTVRELQSAKMLPENDYDLILKGFYPPVYDQEIPFADWYANYISTYVQKDVRQLKNISNLRIFERFLSILAGRTAQEFNMTAISNMVGIDVKTVQSWASILESSYIIYFVKPYHKNINKTIVKRPKLFFTDTGLVCNLLNITNKDHLINHPLRGAIFENLVVSEILKNNTNKGIKNNLFYWRDKYGHEIDLLIEKGNKMIPLEIKSAKTINNDFFKNLIYWQKKYKGGKEAYLIYAGTENQKRSNGIEVVNWRKIITDDAVL